jgi:hypothetical protein
MPSIKNFKYFSFKKFNNFSHSILKDYSENKISFDYMNDSFSFETQSNLFDLIQLENTSTLLSSSQELIFPGLKYIYKNHIVYERPPTYKLINCYSSYLEQIDGSTKLHSYYIPIPWQLYIAEFDDSTNRVTNVRMYFMNSPLYSEDQILYLPPILNFYVNGQLCRPFFSSLDDIEKYTPDISGIISSSYDWVWASNFNLDLTETISSIYSQNKPVEISSQFTESSFRHYRLNMFHVHHTYSFLEKLSLNEVTSFIWPNPAYNQSFQNDSISVDRFELASEYISNNDLYDEDEHGSYEEFVEYIIDNDEDFRDTLPISSSIAKTYSQIIASAIVQSDFSNVKNSDFSSKIIKQYTKSSNSFHKQQEEFEPF